MSLKINGVKYQSIPNLIGRPIIRNAGEMTFGKNVTITSSLKINPTGGKSPTCLFTAPGTTLKIGDRVAMSNCVIHVKHSVTIGEDVLLGGGVQIFDSDFHSLIFEERMIKNEKFFKKAGVSIENGVFIGGSTIILKGVTIGAFSIVGAGSVVTKSIPPNEIWAGNPAKFLKKVPIKNG